VGALASLFGASHGLIGDSYSHPASAALTVGRRAVAG